MGAEAVYDYSVEALDLDQLAIELRDEMQAFVGCQAQEGDQAPAGRRGAPQERQHQPSG